MRSLMAALVILLAASSFALATPTPLDSSGWSYEVGPGVTASVQFVSLGDNILRVTLAKDFGPVEVIDGESILASCLINFIRTGQSAVNTIVIQSETIQNNSGLAWQEFYWTVPQTNQALINQSASIGWVPSPFSTVSWVTASSLVCKATGGTLPSGQSFSPSADLTIDVAPFANSFTLKEWSDVPEPVTLALLAAGSLALLPRRRRA